MSLATKYRPQNFDEVVGQDIIKTILTNQISKGKIKNSYLFVGASGTGKTTCARIFANEINKEQGNPMEIDAASNNSVEDVRVLIDKAKSSSITSKYNVFILDECHMFSNQAWNAALKLIEEPPANSVFIFCTTEANKVPSTILSRTQRFDFSKVDTKLIAKRLCSICDNEYIVYDSDGIDFIAELSNGCMREAINIVEKCSDYGDINVENCKKVLYDNKSSLETLYKAILEENNKVILDTIQGVYDRGIDLKTFIKDLLDYVVERLKDSIKEDTKNKDISLVLEMILNLYKELKYEQNPKLIIEATLLGGIK